MSTCEWDECEAGSSHVVVVEIADENPETWRLCREHDRLIKMMVVRNRPKATQGELPSSSGEVRCGGCGEQLNERTDLALEERRPCEDCGSIVRHKFVHLSERIELHESLRTRTKRAGRPGWVVDGESGDNYTRDLEAWGKLVRIKDREADLYKEVIELYDGTKISSTARLSDHKG